jgi:hypothetical protein
MIRNLYRRLALFLGIVWRVYDAQDGTRISVAVAWSVACGICPLMSPRMEWRENDRGEIMLHVWHDLP